MRVKFIDNSANAFNKTTILEISGMYLLDDTNEIYLHAANDELYNFKSTKALRGFDESRFLEWIDILLINGYLDLTRSDYVFEPDTDEDEDDSDEEDDG